jgi:protein phosphatase
MATKANTRYDGNLILPEEHGPFHVIGDVHGCFQELVTLLGKLGYQIRENGPYAPYGVIPPVGYKVVFVGDLVDRGPDSPEVLRLVMDMVESGLAFCVIGNHDDKLYRKLSGRNVQMRYGLELTMQQLGSYRATFVGRVRDFLGSLPHHVVLDNGRLVVAHAGLKEDLHGCSYKGVREYCLYGPTNGETDAHGLPVRLDWAADYSGAAIVVYGHTPVHDAVWRNNTINIDTGCVFGGKLSALTYPDNVITEVESLTKYAEPIRPFVRHSA